MSCACWPICTVTVKAVLSLDQIRHNTLYDLRPNPKYFLVLPTWRGEQLWRPTQFLFLFFSTLLIRLFWDAFQLFDAGKLIWIEMLVMNLEENTMKEQHSRKTNPSEKLKSYGFSNGTKLELQKVIWYWHFYSKLKIVQKGSQYPFPISFFLSSLALCRYHTCCVQYVYVCVWRGMWNRHAPADAHSSSNMDCHVFTTWLQRVVLQVM